MAVFSKPLSCSRISRGSRFQLPDLVSKILFPPVRIAAQIHHGDDQDFSAAYLVEQAVRKAMRSATARSLRKGEPSLRMGFDQSGGGFNFRQEFPAQTHLRSFVELHRLFEFQFGN